MKHSWYVFAVFVILAAALLVTGYFINPQGTVEATQVANLGGARKGTVVVIVKTIGPGNVMSSITNSIHGQKSSKSCMIYLSSGVVVFCGRTSFHTTSEAVRSTQLN